MQETKETWLLLNFKSGNEPRGEMEFGDFRLGSKEECLIFLLAFRSVPLRNQKGSSQLFQRLRGS